jgi:23S rRNA (cytidine1920-2'-O)/16S rRNA (cytidine1409-2'-O)-methyltransferase
MRIDQLLCERGLASSRSQAQRLIAAGVQWRLASQLPWRRVAKNGDEVPQDAELELLDLAESRYVSRGGLKLEGALRRLGLDVTGLHCLDVGQSTGGFTDCLLQHGAAQVVGVDVGYGQVHQRIREDARVTCIERVNARELVAADLMPGDDTDTADATLAHAMAQDQDDDWDDPVDLAATVPDAANPASDAGGAADAPQFDLVTGDLSFISLTLVLPALVPFLKAEGDLLMLVKPQFELQPGQVGKGGLVKDPAYYPVVEQRLRDCCTALGLVVLAWLDSPITGGDGNREFFVHARHAGSMGDMGNVAT